MNNFKPIIKDDINRGNYLLPANSNDINMLNIYTSANIGITYYFLPIFGIDYQTLLETSFFS